MTDVSNICNYVPPPLLVLHQHQSLRGTNPRLHPFSLIFEDFSLQTHRVCSTCSNWDIFSAEPHAGGGAYLPAKPGGPTVENSLHLEAKKEALRNKEPGEEEEEEEELRGVRKTEACDT